MDSKIEKFEDFKEDKDSLIDIEKLEEVAKSILVLCNGEYGDTFFNESEQKIFVMLGDSNPFDMENLEYQIKDSICTTDDYKDVEKIDVEIENECYPCGRDSEDVKDWKIYKNNEFVQWK